MEILSDFRLDNIFSDFLISCKVELNNNDLILEEVYANMQEDLNGVTRSNRHGWHSKQFNNIEPNLKFLNINDLANQVIVACNRISQDLKLQHVFKRTDFWINVNDEGSYNILHGHPKCEISCVYYAKVTEDCGELTILRTDGAMHHYLYKHLPQFIRMIIKPEVGRLYFFPSHLLHYVTTNQSKEQRVSIAFNVSI